MSEYKTCTKCGQVLHINLFNKFARAKDGLSVWCKECNKSYQKQHRLKNLERYLKSSAEWRLENKDQIKLYGRLYYQENKEILSAKNAEWRTANAERKKENDRKWAKENPDKVKFNHKNWRLKNPEKQSLARQLRRARVRNASLFIVTGDEIAKLLNKPCFYCGGKAEHIDHIVPLSRGGCHSVGNLTSACASCNLSKNNKTIMEWRLWKMRLGLHE